MTYKRIFTPKYQAPDIYAGTLTAVSDRDAKAFVRISATVPESYAVESVVAPTYNEAVPGEAARYAVTFSNEGNVADVYHPGVEYNNTSVQVGNMSYGWMSANRSFVSLTPGSSATITIDITPPRKWYTVPGDYDFLVNVSSPNAHSTSPATLKVLGFSAVDIDITGGHVSNPPAPVIDPDLQRIIKENPSGKVKVLIRTTGKPGKSEKASIESDGGNVKYVYHLIDGIAAEVPRAERAFRPTMPAF